MYRIRYIITQICNNITISFIIEILMPIAKTLLLTSALLSASACYSHAEINIVASIKPIHSLVSAVMEGVGTPDLIIDGANSPHNFTMKPSQAKMLEAADIIFWVGQEMEPFLEKSLDTVGKNAKAIEMMDAHGLKKINLREGGPFENHSHDEEDEHEGPLDDHDEHNQGKFDAHIWLDPVNAKKMIHQIEEALISIDPANAEKFERNAEVATAKIDTLIANVSNVLKPVKEEGYIVFHDAYQYFEQRFGINASGSITVSPETMPGAERISEIRARVRKLGATCVFSEPQFQPKLISTITQGTNAKGGIIDPLGASLTNGSDLYFKLIRNMAASIRTCLTEAS